jgi:putative endonuclease
MTNAGNNVLYAGVTNDLARRVSEHQNKTVDGFTKKYNVHKLVYYEVCENIEGAIAREKQLKGILRSKKDELVAGFNPQWRDLSGEL